VSNFARTLFKNERILDSTERQLKAAGPSIQLAEPEPIRVSVTSLRNSSGERKTMQLRSKVVRCLAAGLGILVFETIRPRRTVSFGCCLN
jgi:hypothetical protein